MNDDREYFRFTGYLWEETEKAYRLSMDLDSPKNWVPRSQVPTITKFAKLNSSKHGVYRYVECKMTEWAYNQKVWTT